MALESPAKLDKTHITGPHPQFLIQDCLQLSLHILISNKPWKTTLREPLRCFLFSICSHICENLLKQVRPREHQASKHPRFSKLLYEIIWWYLLNNTSCVITVNCDYLWGTHSLAFLKKMVKSRFIFPL